MKRQGGQKFGRYVLVRELGAGGMGEVWEALDPSLDRPVAIKFVRAALATNTAYVERLKREALAAARIKHENVGRVYDLGTEGDQLYLVMELIDGVDMKALLERVPRGRLDMVRACYFMWQVLRGLAAAHAAGVVHRDLKPENVMVSEGGHVTVIDFGLAGEGPRSGLGTARFLSPEAVNGASTDARADLYAVGLLLYIALAGEGPYPDVRAADTDEAAVVAAHLFAAPAPLGDEHNVPEELWRVIERLLRKAPEERYQTADAAAGALAHCMTGSVPPSHPLGSLIAGGVGPQVVASLRVQAAPLEPLEPLEPGREAWAPPSSAPRAWPRPPPSSRRVLAEPTAPLPSDRGVPESARHAAMRPDAASPASSSTLAWAPRASRSAGPRRRVSPWLAAVLVLIVPIVLIRWIRPPKAVALAPAALVPTPAPAPAPAPSPTSSVLAAASAPPATPAPSPTIPALAPAPPPAAVPSTPKPRARPVPAATATAAPTAAPALTASGTTAASPPSRRPFNVEE